MTLLATAILAGTLSTVPAITPDTQFRPMPALLIQTERAAPAVILAKKEKHGSHGDRDDRESDRHRSKRLQENHKINPTYGSRQRRQVQRAPTRGLFFGGSFFKTGLFFQ